MNIKKISVTEVGMQVVSETKIPCGQIYAPIIIEGDPDWQRMLNVVKKMKKELYIKGDLVEVRQTQYVVGLLEAQFSFSNDTRS
jgi:hypothetical protein